MNSPGTATGWQELGNGVYRYTSSTNLATVTSPMAVAYEPSLTHRASIAIDLSGAAARALAPDNPFKDFVPAGGDVTANKLIADTKNCADCHVRFAEHGGPRRSNEYCVVCHNPASIDPDCVESVDFAYMAHSIHRGLDRTNDYIVYGFNGTQYNFGDVTYPQSTLFCETCHTQSAAAPQGDDWLSNPSAASCGGCHDAGLARSGPDAATGLNGYVYTELGLLCAAFMGGLSLGIFVAERSRSRIASTLFCMLLLLIGVCLFTPLIFQRVTSLAVRGWMIRTTTGTLAAVSGMGGGTIFSLQVSLDAERGRYPLGAWFHATNLIVSSAVSILSSAFLFPRWESPRFSA